MPKPLIPCARCKKPTNNTIFCSVKCAVRSRKPAKVMESNEQILDYLNQNSFNYEAAGRHFGCTGAAIKKRLRKTITLPVKKARIVPHPCPICSTPTKNKVYCGKPCATIGFQKCSDEAIVEAMKSSKTMREIGRRIGMDHSSVRRRIYTMARAMEVV